MFESIVKTLNSIEVHGKDNLDKMLGCIILLEKMEAEIEKTKANQTVTDKQEGSAEDG